MNQKNRSRSWQNFFKISLVLLLIISCFTQLSVAQAAKPDKTAPSAPTNLHPTVITENAVTLAWSTSSDNVGVAGYNIYKNNSLIGSTTALQFTVTNLSPKTSYSFYIKAKDKSGNLSASSNTIQVTTLAPVDQPPTIGTLQVTPIASDGMTVSGTVTLSVNASDDKGISKVEFYSSNGGYLIGTKTTAPYSVNWATNPWVPDGSQILKAVVYDSSNQTAQVTKTVTVKNTVTNPNSYKKIGYYAGWATYSNYQVANIDASKLTHLNYAFASISADGKIALGDSWADVEKVFPGDTVDQPYKGNFYQLTKLKQQYPNLKTLISVGGWNDSAKFSDVALTDQSRTIFAESCLLFILQYGFDGVDLDWEYPVSGGAAGNVNRPEDKQNFTLLLQKIRQTFDAQSTKDGKKYLLSVAGGVGKSYAVNTELNLIGQYVDYIQLMTYDLHGEWDSITGFNAPLYKDPASRFSYEWSVQDAVQMYVNTGVPADKLIMGVPFYGRIYYQVANLNNGLYQSYTGGGAALTYGNIEANYLNKNGFTRYWSDGSKVPWLFNGTQFISYDDVESLGYKTSFIKSMGLGGAMMWELSQDPNKVLLTKVSDDLK